MIAICVSQVNLVTSIFWVRNGNLKNESVKNKQVESEEMAGDKINSRNRHDVRKEVKGVRKEVKGVREGQGVR